MAIRALLPGYDVDRTPLEELAPLIEGVFYSKQAILAAAAAMPGSTASSTVSVLIKAVQGLRTGGGASNQPGQSSASGGAANAPTGDAFEDGLTGPAYASFQVAMKAADLLSAAGRRGAFEAATAGDCILTVRLLARGEVWLSKKDPTGALGQLYGLRAFLPEWFTYAAAVDANGAITPALAKWSITGTDQNDTAFLDRFLKSDFVMDWMGSYKTPGLLHYLSALRRQNIAAPHPHDHYCEPAIVRALASFGQSLFSGLGYPKLPAPPASGGPAGFSWSTWWEFYATVLEVGERLATKPEQLDWLDSCEEQAIAFLRLLSSTVHNEIHAVEGLRHRTLGALLPHDMDPARHLRTMVQELEEDLELEARRRPGGRRSQQPARARAFGLPLRSSRGVKLHATATFKRARGGADEAELEVDSAEEEDGSSDPTGPAADGPSVRARSPAARPTPRP